ncbi:MAG TPA: rRNA maturation RNase YbeY, partial [Gemmatimonadota bacterium]|nr:rRNA maturation RNase YbeY [Gemmatimonadota bacterium]
MRIRVRFHPSVAPPADLEPFPGGRLARLLESEWVGVEGEIHCVLTGDAELTDLNHRFRGIDAPTDVLAFPYDPEAAGGSLGDVYVSLARAEAQAGERAEPVAREVIRLFV